MQESIWLEKQIKKFLELTYERNYMYSIRVSNLQSNPGSKC